METLFIKKSQGDLGGKYKRTWTEESINIDPALNDRYGTRQTKSFLGTSVTPNKIRLFTLFIFVIVASIVGRLVYLQLIKGNYFRTQAESNRLRILPVPAERGIFYDRFGKELVQNIPTFNLTIVPKDFPRDSLLRQKIIAQISQISGLSTDEILEQVSKLRNFGYESFIIKENIDYQSALKLYVQNADLPGVQIESGTKRKYLTSSGTNYASSTSLSHIFGYMSKLTDEEHSKLNQSGYEFSDRIGRSGLEKIYETELRGINGKKKVEVNAYGKEQNILAIEPPKTGQNLQLSIDINAQRVLEKAALRISNMTGKRKIAAIALNPQNGEIIAMVSLPTFDNNDFSGPINQTKFDYYNKDEDKPLFNRAVSGTYPPGSTIKLIVSAGALEENVINISTSFNSVGGLAVGKWFFKDWKAGGHGITNVTKAIAWSVNTFFYYVGGGYDNFVGLGFERLEKYFKMFGIGEKTGIDLNSESAGFIPSPTWKLTQKKERWFVGDTYNISIGQGDLLVTPLQVAKWTSLVANGGKIITPHLVQSLIDPVTNKKTKLNFPTKGRVNVQEANLAFVRTGMRDCVLYGSCKMLQNLPVPAAGKTGTAQWSATKPTQAWFTSFAPYSDPQIVVTVLVEEGGEGATVAMPIADEFLLWWENNYIR